MASVTRSPGLRQPALASGSTLAFSEQGIELRNRNPSVHLDAEAPPPTPQPSPKEVHLRSIAECIMYLDLKAAHTVTEGFSQEERLRNVVPHFDHLWKCRPPTDLLERWVESDELYQSHDVIHLPSFHEFVGSLSYKHLAALVDTREASPFYVRMTVGRIWKFQEQKTIHNLAVKDLSGCFDINLGLLIAEKAADENEYLARLTQKQFMAELRLSRILSDARLLRNRITKAFDQEALDKDLLPGLRSRILALQEHYETAWKLLEEKQNETLLDAPTEAWLNPKSAPVRPSSRRQTTVTLACLTLFFTLIAGYPVSRSYASASDEPGLLSDADFWGLLGQAILQLLSLFTQLLGPFVIPELAHVRLQGGEESWVWIWVIGIMSCFLTCLSIALYILLSVRLSGWLAFASQVATVMVQLMLVFKG